MESQGDLCVWNKFMEKYEKGISVVRKCFMPRDALSGLNQRKHSENVSSVITS